MQKWWLGFLVLSYGLANYVEQDILPKGLYMPVKIYILVWIVPCSSGLPVTGSS
jgi:hypothetical protein